MSPPELRTVAPVRPVAPYVGGKKQLAGRLAALIQGVPHDVYCEPFVGMGGVFLRRTRVPNSEVINDFSGDVVNFFRVCQEHYVPLMDLLRFRFTSRREFDRLTSADPSSLTDLNRAVRFLYLQRLTFGGKVAGRSFGVSPELPGRFDVTKLEPQLADLSERLAGVTIENLPYGEFITRYDRPGALFYLDPPYFGSEDYYIKGSFGRSDFARLAAQLAKIAGWFVLSINDAPEIRATFAAFEIEAVDLTYSVNDGDGTAARELIVTPAGLPRVAPAPGLFDWLR